MKLLKRTNLALGCIVVGLAFATLGATPARGVAVPPPAYSSTLDYSRPLEFEVVTLVGTLEWWGSDWSLRGYVGGVQGGRVLANITAFGNKAPTDFSVDPDPVPYVDIAFLEEGGAVNFSLVNVSMTEVAFNLGLGFANFNPGLLCPTNWTKVNETAHSVAVGYFAGTVDFKVGSSTVEIAYRQDTGTQNTTLIYDKSTGVLVTGRVSIFLNNQYTLVITNASHDSDVAGAPVPGLLAVVALGAVVVARRSKRR
ncbi:MAG: hypothetical protein Kow0069_00580 [Promethearchaeota archaeon]